MANPVMVEVTRGSRVECRHRGAVVVADAQGSILVSAGDVDAPVFPRSAVKALQSVPLIESGAAEAAGLTDQELALCCASHNGEEGHVTTAGAILRKAGFDEGALECGAHWPRLLADQRSLILAERDPGALHNNCSGKHAGFLCLAGHLGVDPAGYVRSDHAIQRAVRASLEAFTGAAHDADHCGVDGCSIPTYAVPLTALARGFAVFGTGVGLEGARLRAVERLRSACAAHPFQVAGTDRFCTRIMQRFGERAFVKTGAEGVFCAALPDRGWGVALKCDDGATRAAEVMMAQVLAALLDSDAEEQAFLEPFLAVPLTNWNGISVGAVRASGDLRSLMPRAGADRSGAG